MGGQCFDELAQTFVDGFYFFAVGRFEVFSDLIYAAGSVACFPNVGSELVQVDFIMGTQTQPLQDSFQKTALDFRFSQEHGSVYVFTPFNRMNRDKIQQVDIFKISSFHSSMVWK